jgi:hypothetical protein
MSEKEIGKIKDIYEKDVFLPSQKNICGIIYEDNAAYKCPSNKFCNHNFFLGVCENIDCLPYTENKPILMDSSKFDGSDVSRNKIKYTCERKISTDGKCGLNNNSTKCPDGQCCSLEGTCGYDKESCLHLDPRFYRPMPQYIDSFNNDISNNPINLSNITANLTANLYYFSDYNYVFKYTDNLIKQIGKKYVGNNNFEMSTDGKCGLDLEKEKIFKCPDNQYCGRNSNCSIYDNSIFNNYNNYNNYDNSIYLNFPDLSLNLIHGKTFNEDYNKWYENRKGKIQDIRNKYIGNNNFEISTDGRCGIDLENKKIFKCSGNQYCTRENKCLADNNYKNYYPFYFNNLKDLSSNYIYLPNKDYKLNDFKSYLMHGDKFNEQYDKWQMDNSLYVSYDTCGRNPDSGRLYKCQLNNFCCINNECKTGEICKNADPNSKFHSDSFLKHQSDSAVPEKNYFSTKTIVYIVIIVVFVLALIIFFGYKYKYKYK